MSTFRDEEILIQQGKNTPSSRFPYTSIDDSSEDCQNYGHSWQAFGRVGAKYCTVCCIIGYCPGCTPVSPAKVAQPFYCTKHPPPAKSGGEGMMTTSSYASTPEPPSARPAPWMPLEGLAHL